jgi:radical SAM superfamily enzyme YgiQ (UPF0313 family)
MPESVYPLLEPLLLQVSQPQRYAGVEMGAASKADAPCRAALVFPDLYEMGMAHTGLQLLYRLGNALDGVFLERVFAPWPDLGDRMKAEGIPLFTQETFSAVGDLPLVAFTLPTNLHATNLLYCLDLAGVPLRREERGEEHPIVLAGGLGISNPAPLVEIVDAFALGDGEILLLKALALFRDHPGLSRRAKLEALAAMEGFLVPGISKGPARRVWLPDLAQAPFDFEPLLPAFASAHHRLHVEVARGCARGCRFCEAGFWYRPWRERDAAAVLDCLLRRGPRSGFSEAGLLSLSTADYSAVEPLASALTEGLWEHRVSLSLPSLRVDAATLPLLEKAREVRKSGLTFAPEAGASLRPALNKAVTDEQILETVARAKALGWRTVKLYFMVGLPFETEAHWEELAVLVERVRGVGMRSVTVHVANFVPKPWTPFQWAPAASAEHLERARAFLRARIPRRGVELKLADPAPSRVEAAVSRGDEAMGAVLLEAYRRGCRFDNWTETFRPVVWDALLPPPPAFSEEAELPWERWVDAGLDRAFLLREWRRAREGKFSPACTEACLACGLGKRGEDLRFSVPLREVQSPELRVQSEENAVQGSGFRVESVREDAGDPVHAPTRSPLNAQRSTAGSGTKFRYRLHLTKEGRARFLSYRHFVSFVTEGLLRAGVPLAFSQGFNPRPLVSTGPALPVGVESRDEVVEVWTRAAVEWGAVPFEAPGVRLWRAEPVLEGAPALSKAIEGFRYLEGGAEFTLAPAGTLRDRDRTHVVKLETLLRGA